MSHYESVFALHFTGTEEAAIDYLNQFDFSETEVSGQDIAHARYIDTSNDGSIELYYDYGADYYFFVEVDMYEHDGQPDEMQEWDDFDPDC